MKKNILVSCLSLLLVSISAAKADVMHFERGGASTVPGIVEPGQINLEVGSFDYSDTFKGKGSYGFNAGSSKIRYGINDRLELRLTQSGVAINDALAGMANLGLGFKTAITKDEHGPLPVINLVTEFQIPFGRAELKNPGFNHTYFLTTSHGITERLVTVNILGVSFGQMAGATHDIDTVAIPYLTNLSYAVNDKLGFFTDLYGTWGLTGGTTNPLAADFGFAYAITDNFIYDLSVNKGLNDGAPAFGVSTGLAFRLR